MILTNPQGEKLEIQGDCCTLLIRRCTCGKILGFVNGQGKFGYTGAMCMSCYTNSLYDFEIKRRELHQANAT